MRRYIIISMLFITRYLLQEKNKVWFLVSLYIHTYKEKDSWSLWFLSLYATLRNLYRKIIMIRKDKMCEEREEKREQEKWKGLTIPKSMHRVLGWLNFDLDKQAEQSVCVRACFEKFVRRTCLFARIDTRSQAQLFSRIANGSGCARGRIPWQISYQRHTRCKKKKNSSFFPPPRHDLLVVSWGSLRVLFGKTSPYRTHLSQFVPAARQD